MATASEAYDRMLGAVLGGGPPDLHTIRAQFRDLTATLTRHLRRMFGVPTPKHPFLVLDGEEPAPEQMTETEFIIGLLRRVTQELPAVGSVDRLAASVTSVFKALIELGNTEVLVRMMLDLRDDEVYDAGTVADQLAESLLNVIAGWRDAFSRPVDADVWDPELSEEAMREAADSGAPRTTQRTTTSSMTGAVAALVTTARGPVPKLPGSLPSSGPDGNRVHRYVQEDYANTFGLIHPLIVIEAGDRITPGSPPRTEKLADLVAAGQITDPNLLGKAACYTSGLLNPITGKRWRPDIADLEDAIPLPAILAEWGWFEIKNWKDALEGFFQLSKYCAFYTGAVALYDRTKLPHWAALPGLWFPPPILYDEGASAIFVITRPLPGVIIYYKLDISDLEKVADVTASVIMASLVFQIMKRLLKKLTAVQVPVFALIAWAAVIVVLYLAIVELLGAAAAANLAATAQVIATWMATVLSQLGRTPVFANAPLGN